ncbi:MAG TPA: hypothetical protein VN598_15725, partial [Usitatibacter sp.]|nr:hypothetical protein [Usitatibacter sp.]
MNRASIAVLALAFALAGCGKKEQEAAPKTPAPVAQGPAVAQLPPPATAGPKTDYVCKKNGKCEVAITIKDCSPN